MFEDEEGGRFPLPNRLLTENDEPESDEEEDEDNDSDEEDECKPPKPF